MTSKTDQDMTNIEKIAFYTHRSQEKGACHTMGQGPGEGRHMRKLQAGQEADGGGNCEPEHLLWFL